MTTPTTEASNIPDFFREDVAEGECVRCEENEAIMVYLYDNGEVICKSCYRNVPSTDRGDFILISSVPPRPTNEPKGLVTLNDDDEIMSVVSDKMMSDRIESKEFADFAVGTVFAINTQDPEAETNVIERSWVVVNNDRPLLVTVNVARIHSIPQSAIDEFLDNA